MHGDERHDYRSGPEDTEPGGKQPRKGGHHVFALGANDPWWNYVLISTGEIDKLKLILDHGVAPDVIGDGGFTMLHHLGANDNGQSHRVTLATTLLDVGASLSKRDSLLKSTPLGWACRWGQMDLVQLYLQRSADVLERDAESWTVPLAWATKRGYHEIMHILRSAGAGN